MNNSMQKQFAWTVCVNLCECFFFFFLHFTAEFSAVFQIQ